MTDKLQNLIENNWKEFSDLSSYFGNLTMEHLIGEDLESFVEMVKPEHKIIMSVFIHRYLTPHLHNNLSNPIVNRGISRKISVEDGKLNARGCLKSRSFPFSPNLCISDLGGEVMKLNPKPDSINFVDLSSNSLLSGDLKYVFELLYRLNPILMKDCILSLEENKIHGLGEFRDIVDQFVRESANSSKIGYIDLRSNPFSTVDRKDFFMALGVNDQVTKKLIWMENYNLSGQGWTQLVKSEEVISVVKKAHSQYFNLLFDRQKS